jgi:mono/diheme cytochrome c family protein
MKLKIAIGILFLVVIVIVSCQNDKQLEFEHYFSNGRSMYQDHCQNCHGQQGEGLKDLIPPLTDSIFLKNNITVLPCSIKFGLKGKFTIANRQFDSQMPPNDLAPIEIAEVLTYVTNSFGNKAGTITSAQVDGDLAGCK